MTKTLLLLGFGLVMAACATDDNDGAGGGDDTLPKRGDKTTDPTIVSAKLTCALSCGDDGCRTDKPPEPYVFVSVTASDMGGASNLGVCSAALGAKTDQDTYSGSTCTLAFPGACPGGSVAVGLTVSNDTGGVTTASVTLPVSAN